MTKNEENSGKLKNSFYFEEYRQSSENSINKKLSINQDRIYLLFFIFFSLIFMFAIKIISLSLQEPTGNYKLQNSSNFKLLRNDILDRNGILIARNIKVYHVAIKPNLIKDKKKFFLKLKLLSTELDISHILNSYIKKKYF